MSAGTTAAWFHVEEIDPHTFGMWPAAASCGSSGAMTVRLVKDARS